jgi:hypothetical protein
MALSQAILKAEFLKLFDPAVAVYPATVVDAITNWSNAYNTYALNAVDVSGDPVVTVNLAGFTAALTASILPCPPGTDITTCANAFDSAFVAYWTLAAFSIGSLPPGIYPCLNVGGTLTFGIETTSIVSVVTPGVLSALLLTEFANLSSDYDAKADDLAQAFHDATTSAVLVTIVGEDTIGGPITNTCTIF